MRPLSGLSGPQSGLILTVNKYGATEGAYLAQSLNALLKDSFPRKAVIVLRR